MIKKGELLLRIIDIESICEGYDEKIINLEKKIKKLEKAVKPTIEKKTAKKTSKKAK